MSDRAFSTGLAPLLESQLTLSGQILDQQSERDHEWFRRYTGYERRYSASNLPTG
ncbi:hypothetical protein GCM10023195_82590 [Actinoallomurus liliacearum]|uniref:Uncharacterized protein n=1 Tax=Actinoallomurus liliacearum TaxID=1080073 RepID=A0ABP8U0X8_9ACTN